MHLDRDLAETIAEIVSAAVQPDRWTGVCDRIVGRLGATAFVVMAYDVDSHAAPMLRTSSEFALQCAPVIETMLDHTDAQDIEAYERFARVPPGRLVTEAEIMGFEHDRALPANSFRNAMFAPLGTLSRNPMRLNDIGPWIDMAALHLPVWGQDITDRVRREVTFLGPILGKALETERILRGLSRRYSALIEAFDLLDFGAAFVDEEGRIVLANRSFHHIAAERDGLAVTGGTVTAIEAADRVALRRLMTAALRPGTAATDLICALKRRSGMVSLVVKAAPIRDPELGSDALTLLLVIDPDDERRITAAGLTAFGLLTPAELEVCELLIRGAPTEEIAERRSTTLQTTRSQIKAASEKLACTSRLDLVRLALATRPPTRPD